MRHLAQRERLEARLVIDSAGTHDDHAGEAPDHRSIATAARFGVDISPLRARQVTPEDFETFDLLLALDRGHYAHLARQARNHHAKLQLFLPYGGVPAEDVPDPYYGGPQDFDLAYRLIAEGCEGVLRRLRAHP